MKALNNILLFVLLAAAGTGFGQDLTSRAHAQYSAKNYDSARVWIDSAVVTNEKYNSQTWQLHGLIYRKLESPAHPEHRETAINSFLMARERDTTNLYSEQISGYLLNTIIRYYNDAVTLLNDGNYTESERSYTIYKEKHHALINPGEDFTAKDIEYYNALGGGYTKQLPKLSGKEHDIVFALAVSALNKVLEADSMNYLANLNTAVLYYNKGADLIVNQDPFADIEVLLKNIEISEMLFKKALPMMLKAYSMNPESIEVIEGLAGIYFGLNDDENCLIYRTRLDTMNLPGLLKDHENDPTNKETLKELVRIYSTTLKDSAQYDKFKAILDSLGG